MQGNSDLIAQLFEVIDCREWGSLKDFFTVDVVYNRPGYEPMYGITAVHDFYLRRRSVAQGRHTIESIVTEVDAGFCWGTFVGTSTRGHPLKETFADWYQFHNGKIRARRSFFYRRAI